MGSPGVNTGAVACLQLGIQCSSLGGLLIVRMLCRLSRGTLGDRLCRCGWGVAACGLEGLSFLRLHCSTWRGRWDTAGRGRYCRRLGGWKRKTHHLAPSQQPKDSTLHHRSHN